MGSTSRIIKITTTGVGCKRVAMGNTPFIKEIESTINE
jgi:hypothetical protein